jgi:hypothetical protein
VKLSAGKRERERRIKGGLLGETAEMRTPQGLEASHEKKASRR